MKKADIRSELRALEKKEQKLLSANKNKSGLKDAIYEKVPEGLAATLEAAFAKAFKLVFLKGTHLIEKTFDKETVTLDYEAGDYIVDKAGSKQSINRRIRKGKIQKTLFEAKAGRFTI